MPDMRVAPYCSVIVCPWCKPVVEKWGGRHYLMRANHCGLTNERMTPYAACPVYSAALDWTAEKNWE